MNEDDIEVHFLKIAPYTMVMYSTINNDIIWPPVSSA